MSNARMAKVSRSGATAKSPDETGIAQRGIMPRIDCASIAGSVSDAPTMKCVIAEAISARHDNFSRLELIEFSRTQIQQLGQRLPRVLAEQRGGRGHTRWRRRQLYRRSGHGHPARRGVDDVREHAA